MMGGAIVFFLLLFKFLLLPIKILSSSYSFRLKYTFGFLALFPNVC